MAIRFAELKITLSVDPCFGNRTEFLYMNINIYYFHTEIIRGRLKELIISHTDINQSHLIVVV